MTGSSYNLLQGVGYVPNYQKNRIHRTNATEFTGLLGLFYNEKDREYKLVLNKWLVFIFGKKHSKRHKTQSIDATGIVSNHKAILNCTCQGLNMSKNNNNEKRKGMSGLETNQVNPN